MNRVTVKIAGVEYPIAGEETKEYLENLGAIVNEEVEKIIKNSTGISMNMATTLAAINIADKFLKKGNNEGTTNNKKSDIVGQLEYKLQEKEVQIESLMAKLDEALESKPCAENDTRVQELMDISNEFQNRIFELQQEVELLQNQLNKADDNE